MDKKYCDDGNDANVLVSFFFLFGLKKVLNRKVTEYTDESEGIFVSNSYHLSKSELVKIFDPKFKRTYGTVLYYKNSY